MTTRQAPSPVSMVYGATYERTTCVDAMATNAKVRPVESECFTIEVLLAREAREQTIAPTPEWEAWVARQRAKRLTQAQHPCPLCGVRPTIDDPCSECAERTHLGLPIPA